MNYNCSYLLDMRNIQEQVKKAFCYQKLFWPFTVRINCSSYLKKFSRSLEQFFFLTVGQNNFGNKIPFPIFLFWQFNWFQITTKIFWPHCDIPKLRRRFNPQITRGFKKCFITFPSQSCQLTNTQVFQQWGQLNLNYSTIK